MDLVLVNIQMPDGATLDRTYNAVQQAGKVLDETDGVLCLGRTGGLFDDRCRTIQPGDDLRAAEAVGRTPGERPEQRSYHEGTFR